MLVSKIFSAILEGWSPRARKRNREEEEEKKDEEQGNEKIDAVEEILQRNTKEEKKQEKKPKRNPLLSSFVDMGGSEWKTLHGTPKGRIRVGTWDAGSGKTAVERSGGGRRDLPLCEPGSAVRDKPICSPRHCLRERKPGPQHPGIRSSLKTINQIRVGSKVMVNSSGVLPIISDGDIQRSGYMTPLHVEHVKKTKFHLEEELYRHGISNKAAHSEFYAKFMNRFNEILQSEASKRRDTENKEETNIKETVSKSSWKDHYDRMKVIVKKASMTLDYESAKRREDELQEIEQGLTALRKLRLTKGRPALREIPLPELSQADLDTYEELISQPSAGPLLKHPASMVDLTGRDLCRLAPGCWLNDEIINLYLRLLQERDTEIHSKTNNEGYPKCHFFNSFFLSKLYKDSAVYDYNAVRRWTAPARLKNAGQSRSSILDCDRIIVPVNQSNTHWVCAMIDLANQEFHYYDSLKGEDPKCLEYLAQYIRDEFKNKKNEDREDVMSWPRLFPKDVPQQKNGYDCGVFLVIFANYLSQGATFNFTQDDIDIFRAKMAVDFSKMSA